MIVEMVLNWLMVKKIPIIRIRLPFLATRLVIKANVIYIIL